MCGYLRGVVCHDRKATTTSRCQIPLALSRWLRPTLELVGIYGGVKDGLKTIVPSQATLKVVARLVPNQKPAAVMKVQCSATAVAGS